MLWLRKIIILLGALVLLFGCKESNKSQIHLTTPQVRMQQQPEENDNENQIIIALKSANLKYFPQILSLFFENNQSVKLKYIDNTTLKIYTENNQSFSLLQIKLLEYSKNKNALFFINAVRHDSLLYQNYFYILQTFKNKAENLTLYLLPESFTEILKLELSTDFHYQKLGNFWAYISERSQYALYFDFYGNICFVKKCFLAQKHSQENCKKILKLTWTGKKFALKLIEQNNRPGLLTAKQLDKVRRFTSLEQALQNPKQVFILDLDGKGLKKLPAQIKYLKKLQILILNNNKLDSLPDELGSLTHLQIIKAENNRIRYVPKSLGYLFYLEELNLANNRIDWIPYEFANLKNLEKLNLSGNQLKVLAFDMSNLQHLYSINLSRNKFEKIPYQIFKLKNLIYLDLSYNPIKNLPRELIDMKTLQYLVIKNTNIDTNQVKYLKLKRQDLQIIY